MDFIPKDTPIERKRLSPDISFETSARTEHARLSDSVYQTLLEAIITGKLAPGTIVSEVSLAKKLSVIRTPVHDALRQLAKDNLVEQRAGRRAVVASFSRDDVFDIFEMRKILEGEAAARSAGRMDRATLANLRQQGQQMRDEPNHPEWRSLWADFDDAFHDAIARASGSRLLWQESARYRLLLRSFYMITTALEVLPRALEEHFRVLEALESRDAEAARRAMVEHIQEWQAYFVQHFPR